MAEGTIGRYTFDRVHLSVDAKYKVNDRGWTILTVSLLCKDFPRNTHLSHGRKLRTQGKATTTRAFPVLQAIMHAETIQSVSRVFRKVCELWAEAWPSGPALQDMTTQVHKDYHDALEGARRAVFPKSRPVNDYFHLVEKERSMSAKCCKLVLHKGRYVKENYDWLIYTLGNVRFAPRPDIFSFIWQGILCRLIVR